MKKKMVTKKIAAAVLSGCMAVSLMTGCGSNAPEAMAEETAEAEDKGVLVETTLIQNGDITLSNEFMGTVSAAEEVMIIPKVTGEITEVNFEVGDEVKAGEVLLKINDDAARMQLSSAQLSVESAELSKQGAEITKETAEKTAESTLTTSQELAQISNEGQLDSIQQQIDAAQVSQSTANKNAHDYSNAASSADDALQDVKGQITQLKGAYESLKGYSARVKTEYDSTNDSWDFVPMDGQDYTQDEQDAISSIQGMGKSAYDVTSYGLSEMSSQLSSLEAQASSLRSSRDSANAAKEQAESTASTYGNSIGYYEENLERTKKSQEIQNTTQLQETAESLQRQVASAELGVNSASVGIETAQAAVETAQLQLSYYTIASPISGIIESRSVDRFDMASAGQPVYTIANKDSMTVTFYVSEDVKNTLSDGQEIEITRNDKAYAGNITEIGQSVDTATGLFQIKASVPVTGDELPSGVTVKIKASTYSAANTLIVPYDAVYYTSGEAYVYCVEDGVAVKRTVETGLFNDDTMQIISGLNAGDEVVTSWSSQLMDGSSVYTHTSSDNDNTEDIQEETVETTAADENEETDAAAEGGETEPAAE